MHRLRRFLCQEHPHCHRKHATTTGVGAIEYNLVRQKMLWNTLLIVLSDNGGATYDTVGRDHVGASNFPLRGGKHTIWEGGTRGLAFVSSPHSPMLVPAARRGAVSNNLMHVSDWFATICAVAGVEHEDLTLDGVNQWPAIAQGKPSRRKEVLYGMPDNRYDYALPFDDALRDADGWKLIVFNAGQGNTTWPNANPWYSIHDGETRQLQSSLRECTSASCAGTVSIDAAPQSNFTPFELRRPTQANHSRSSRTTTMLQPMVLDGRMVGVRVPPAGRKSLRPMLFNVLEDESERYDRAEDHPEIVNRLFYRMKELHMKIDHVEGGGIVADPMCAFSGRGPRHAEHGVYAEPWCRARDAAPLVLPLREVWHYNECDFC